jgi:hypothetical protein
MADIINNGVPTPAMIYGRAPNGQLQAVTTDGAGNISFAGAGGAPAFPVNSQTTSYQTVAADFSSFKLITMNGTLLTLTLLAVAPPAGQGIFVQNISTSSVLTIARNGLSIDGVAANITVSPNTGAMIVSDGSNYSTFRGVFGNGNLSFSGNTLTIGLAGGTFGNLALNDSTGGVGTIFTNGTGPISVSKSFGLVEISAPSGVASNDLIFGESTTHTISYNANSNGTSSFSGAWVNTNLSPVTVAANVTTDQNLMSASVPAGTLNRVGRSLRFYASGVYSTAAASTAVVTVKVKFGALTLINIVTTALGGVTAANNQFNLSGMLSVQTGGASGAFEPHGVLVIDLGAGNLIADTSFADTNTATVGTVDLTAAQTLQVTIAFSAASTSNSTTQRQMALETVG